MDEPLATVAAPEVAEVVTDYNRFGYSLLQQPKYLAKNFVCSPFSLHMIVTMLAQAVTDKAYAQLVTAFGLHPINNENIARTGSLCATLLEAKQGVEVKMSNLFAYEEGRDVSETWLLICAKLFDLVSKVFAKPINVTELVSYINGEVDKATNGLIKDLVNESSLQGVIAILVNTIYMNAEWMSQFESKSTNEMDFHTFDAAGKDRTVKCQMMHAGLLHLHHYDEIPFVSVVLPYADDRLEMICLMVTKGLHTPAKESLDRLNQAINVTPDIFAKVYENSTVRQVELWLPKFTVSADIDLTQAIKDAGAQMLFDPAETFALGGEISEIKQRCVLKCNEKGTEAAAATYTMMRCTSMRPIEPEVNACFDSPFVYAVREKSTGAILFMGRCVDPTV